MTRKTITQPAAAEAETPLTADELRAIRERHRPVAFDTKQFCVADGVTEWPCDAERALAEVEQLQAREVQVLDVLDPCHNYTSGDCVAHGRDITSSYTADGYCLPCKIRTVLSR